MPDGWFDNLAESTRRDGTFMRQLLELEKSDHVDRSQIEAQLPAYASYLRTCASSARGTITPVPSKPLDLMWHTHQFHPRRYATE